MTLSGSSTALAVAGLAIFLTGFEYGFVSSLTMVTEAAPEARGRAIGLSNMIGTLARSGAVDRVGSALRGVRDDRSDGDVGHHCHVRRGGGVLTRLPRLTQAEAKSATHPATSLGMRVGAEVMGAGDDDQVAAEPSLNGDAPPGVVLLAELAAHRQHGSGDLARATTAPARRRSSSSPTSAGPSARRASRVAGGRRSQRASPISRRMNRSAAARRIVTPRVASAPAVVPGHHGSHDSGVS